MSLVLDSVSKVVDGQNHIYPTDLRLQRGTLMRLMAGLDVPATGRVIWEGRDVTGMRVQDRKPLDGISQMPGRPLRPRSPWQRGPLAALPQS